MKYEDEYLIVYYNECDKKYLEKIVALFKVRIKSILSFFGIELEDKVVIKLYDKKDKYKTNLERAFSKEGLGRRYHNWMIADSEDGNINMLSLDTIHQIPGFEDYKEKDFCLNACHEFVHICQQKVNSMSPGWFWEVLATRLGNPECQHETKEPFTMEDLETRFDEIDGYGAAFKIANYLFKNYDVETIRSLVKDEGKLYRIVGEIIDNLHNMKVGK